MFFEVSEDCDIERRGNDQCDYGDKQHRGIDTGVAAGELLAFAAESAGDNAHAKDKQDVSDDASGEGGFNDLRVPGAQGEEGNDEFGGVPHGCIEQATGP